MTATHPNPYPAYKPSGVPWLGDVPEHWEVRRLKEATTIIAGQSPPSGIVSEYLDNCPFLQGNAEFGRMHPSARLACETPPKWARAGDILLSVRAPVGALNVADQDYGIGRGLCAVRTRPGLHRLFTYYTLGVANQELLRLSTGSTYDAVTVGIVGGLALPLPPLPEQAAIVRYLDHVDRRIRRYVTAKRKLIALLEEEKQAIVNRAVTRGLDPNVRLKPSGVQWLGDVPSHWEVQRLKTLCSMKSGEGITAESIETTGEYPVYGGNGLRGYASSYTHDGAFTLVGRQGALCGNVHIARGQFWASEHAVVATLGTGHDIEWFGAILTAMNLNRYSIAAAQPGLAVERVLNLHLPIPPKHEQKHIANHLEEATTDIDSAIARARRQIELLQEYRTRLIADVVTGKLDVREAAAQLPEDADDQDPIEESGSLADGLDEDLYDAEDSVDELAIEREVTV